MEALAERARQSCADGTFRRKTTITAEERQAASTRLKANNPVNNPEVRAKISATLQAQAKDLAERLDLTRRAGKLNIPPMSEERRIATSERMKVSNPMKRPDVAAKVSAWQKEKYISDPKATAEAWIRAGSAPNKAESLLADTIAPLGFSFVGNATFWIGPCQSGSCRNPDFIYGTGRKRIAILLHGEYWHRPETDTIELADYQSLNWRVLTIWTKELTNPPAIYSKVETWLHGLASSE